MSVEDMQFALVELKESRPWLRNYHSKMLHYNAKLVIEVSLAYTSIECSRCHKMVPRSLAVRTHVCPNCGLVIDRDHNSAIVVKQRGRALLCLPQELREVTFVETRRESLRQEEAIGIAQ
jgi:putative transposase